jgi:hypothetical protein
MDKKQYSILGIVAVVITIFWWVAKPWILDPKFSLSNATWGWPVLWLLIASATISLAFSFLTDRKIKSLVSVIMAVSFILVFGFKAQYWTYYLSGIAFTLLFHWIGMGKIEDDLRNRVKVKMFYVAQASMIWILIPFMVALSFVYFLTPDVQGAGQYKKLPPSVEGFVRKSTEVVTGFQLKDYSETEKNRLEKQLVGEVVGQINDLFGPYYKYAPPILAFGLFLVLQGLSFIFIPLASLIAGMIFIALKYAKLVKIEEKDVKAEVLSI